MQPVLGITNRVGGAGRVLLALWLAACVLFVASSARAGECAVLPKLESPSIFLEAVPRLVDNFEKDQPEAFWSLKRIERHGYVKSATFVKSGSGAILLTVRHGDKEDPGGRDDRCSERAELSETSWPRIGADLWYGFSLYLPYDLPTIDRRLVLAQIKHDRGKSVGVFSFEDGNPVMALRLRQIKGSDILCFSVTPGNDDPLTDKLHMAIVQIDRASAVARWHNIVLHARIMPGDTENSRAEWWFDDQPVPRTTDLPIALGYVQGGDRSYFKMGPYRDQAIVAEGELDLEWTFGFDEFKRGASWDEVAPTPLHDPFPLQGTKECRQALNKDKIID